jgi:hypothetical protein
MRWIWQFWRQEVTAVLRRAAGRDVEEPRTHEHWESRLVEAGVTSDLAERLALGLACRHRDLGRGTAAPLIQGAALAVELQATAQADVERSLRDVREVERLLGAFSGELEKLDEVLEVLAAYAQRMRAKPASPARRVLH